MDEKRSGRGGGEGTFAADDRVKKLNIITRSRIIVKVCDGKDIRIDPGDLWNPPSEVVLIVLEAVAKMSVEFVSHRAPVPGHLKYI